MIDDGSPDRCLEICAAGCEERYEAQVDKARELVRAYVWNV